jgi:ubiquinone biosynthesis protein
LRRFDENFADFEGVRFPHVYTDLSAARVLTMEYVAGTKVDALDVDGRHADIGTRLQQMFLKMCFQDGYLHADLHPGNLTVTPDGEVVVFDCGLVVIIQDDVFDEFLDFNRCIAMGEADDFVTHLRTFHTYLEGVDWDALSRDCVEFAATFRGKPASELETSVLINGILALGRRYKVRPRTEMALVMVGFVTAEGIGKMLNPDSDSMRAVATFLMPLMQQRLAASAT